MYQPGMDQGLAQTRYTDMLAESAQARSERQTQHQTPKQSVRRLVLAFAALLPIALAIAWVFVAH